jgi:phage antirepressor YoqD-like protein
MSKHWKAFTLYSLSYLTLSRVGWMALFEMCRMLKICSKRVLDITYQNNILYKGKKDKRY